MKPNLHLSVPNRTEGDEGELDLKDLIAQILARKWWIAAATVLGVFIGAFVGQLGPNTYQATSVVQIEKRDSGVMLPSELIGTLIGQPSSAGSLDTEVHIINSRLILGPVVQELGLNTRVIAVRAPLIGDIIARRQVPILSALTPRKYARPQESISARFLEVPEDLIGRPLTLRVTGPESFEVTGPDGSVVAGTVGTPITFSPTHSLVVTNISAPEGRVFTLWQELVRNSVERLRGGLAIRERGSSGIVDFRFSDTDPEDAQNIVNAVVTSYQASNLERRSLQIDRSIAFLEQQLTDVRTNLERANRALIDYREQQQSEQLSLNTQRLLDRAVTLESELEDLRFRESEMAERLTPNHPDYRALLQQRDRAQERLDELRKSLEDLPETEQELARLTANVDRLTFLDQQLSERIEQLGVQRASTVGNIRVLEPAETARFIGPNRRQPIIMGFALGLVMSIGAVLLLNFFRRGIDDAKGIEELGLSLFATVNRVEGLRSSGAESPLYVLAETRPNDMAVEALRGLRTGLQFSLATAPSRSLMITSTAPNDGKSFISLNLSIVMGQAGNRVLLIDGDMRKGILRKQFGLSRHHPGLSDYLAQKVDLEDVVVHSPERSLDFIATGGYPPTPADLLASDGFASLLTAASAHYDLVIVDAPPVLAVSDPGIIGQNIGMSLMVVQHLVTTKAEIQAAQKTLAGAGVRIAGVVLNQFDSVRSRYGQYGTKYGYYYGGYRYKYE